MEASADLSIITLVAHASAVVQIVLAILLIFSLVSWTIIFQKWFQMSRARREARNFDKRFWGGADLNKLYESATERRSSIGPQEGIFYSGMTEFLRSRASNLEARAGTFGVIDGVSRAMRARYQRELDILESGLSVLATIGSVSPYIGLFGTVWGIMDASQLGQPGKPASLAVVAPGIAKLWWQPRSVCLPLFLPLSATTALLIVWIVSRASTKASCRNSRTFWVVRPKDATWHVTAKDVF